MNVLPTVIPEIADLYQWLEVDFEPLKLCNKVSSVLNFLKGQEDYEQYVNPLKEITTIRMLKQVFCLVVCLFVSLACFLIGS